MNVSQLIGIANWNDVESALLQLHPDAHEGLEGYQHIFVDLHNRSPVTSKMRVCIRTTFRPGIDDEPFTELVGKNGTLNRDQEDFKSLGKDIDSHYALSETEFGLELEPWNDWLGMEIEESTLEKYTHGQVVAHCLYDMTFFGFTETEVDAEREELQRRVDEIDAMTEAERKEKLIPLDQVFRSIEERIKKQC